MVYLAEFHWGWLLASWLMGLAAGWIAVVQRGQGVSRALSRGIAVLVAVLVGVSLARLIPGRPGYWLDLGLVLFVFYLVGCAVGSFLRSWVISRPVSK